MNLPDNLLLPFFAYGIFKPGQLCFTRIKEFVSEYKDGYVKGYLKERDGIPLLIKGDSSKVKGYLIHFHSGKEEEAYNRIIEIEPDEVYKWGEIQVDGKINANVLLGKRDKRGASELENIEEWNGQEDPFFTSTLEEIEDILRNHSNFSWNYRNLFRLQMAYMLLWTAMERYAGLKYHLGKRVTDKVFKIADEQSFADALKKYVKKKRKIFSTIDLEKYTLDPVDPQKSIKYYYQVRSNVVHRGKSVSKDFDTIYYSLKELLAIFKDVLQDAFKEKG